MAHAPQVTRRFRHKFVTLIIHKPRSHERRAHEDGGAAASADGGAEGGFRVPALPVRDNWVRGGRAPQTHGAGGKHANVSWTDASVPAVAAPGGQHALMSTSPPGVAPMDMGSRPASQTAFMEVG